jgi:hypothetical protein
MTESSYVRNWFTSALEYDNFYWYSLLYLDLEPVLRYLLVTDS